MYIKDWNMTFSVSFANAEYCDLVWDQLNLLRDNNDDDKTWSPASLVMYETCLLYTSDAADDMQCVDLGGRRIIKKRIAAKE